MPFPPRGSMRNYGSDGIKTQKLVPNSLYWNSDQWGKLILNQSSGNQFWTSLYMKPFKNCNIKVKERKFN